MSAPGAASAATGPPMDTEAHEALIESLRASGASAERIGAAAWALLAHLLDIEHLQLAAWHACEYEAYWIDDRLRLAVIERLWRLGVESSAIQLCHRWKLSDACREKHPTLYDQMFPKLPPRTFTTTKGDSR